MNRDEMLDRLRKGPCIVNFTKTDGTNREMRCTLDMKFVPEDLQPKTDGNLKESTSTAIRTFDLDKNEWRSFKPENVVSFYG